MDPFSLAAGLAIAIGAIYVDVRGMDRVRERVARSIKIEANATTLVIDQPTEQYVIDFSATSESKKLV